MSAAPAMRKIRPVFTGAVALCVVIMGCSGPGLSRPPVAVGPLRFEPLYAPGAGLAQEVDAFLIDAAPVTEIEFAGFISRNPSWRRDQVPSVLADMRYLSSWDTAAARPAYPATEISYFAAAAFCSWRGGRLPSTLEWETAAAASETNPDASRDPDFIQRILDWYAKPAARSLYPVAHSAPNYWGVYDLHGLIWEWTSDFNSIFVAPDNRRDGEPLPNLFCGAGSSAASDRANYAAFMRYAFRSSLRGNYCLPTLGFRCAYDPTVKYPNRED